MLRLHRAALGRDPDEAGLASLVAARRRGVSIPDLAHALASTPEFEALHGTGSPDEAAGCVTLRMAAQALPAGDPSVAGLAGAMASLSRVQALAAIANSDLVRLRVPLLPGLFPGVSPDDPVAYAVWVELYDTPPVPLVLPPLPGPRITLVMQAGDSEAEAALRTLASLQAGAYEDWDLCLATRLHSAWPARILAQAAEAEPRLRVLPGPGGLDGLNAALAARTGAFAGFVQPGDTLAPTALWEVVRAFSAHPNARLIYTDEDQVGPDGTRHSPRFKTGDITGDNTYAHLAGIPLGGLALYGSAILERWGGLKPGDAKLPDPHQQLASLAILFTHPPDTTIHVPAVLLHRAAPSPAAKLMPRRTVSDKTARTSVILLTKDRADLLAASTAGVMAEIPLGAPDKDSAPWPVNELLIVDNGSTDPDALALLDALAARPGVRVLRRPGPFNFAALNNDAAREAAGDILLLLNNDLEMPQPGWWRALLLRAMLPGLAMSYKPGDVGIVGARLLHRDGTVQHGGMVLGPAGRATHVLRGAPRDAWGYEGQLAVPREVAAVTGACMAIPRAVWNRVGGMNEDLPVAWNDVDLCQRVRAAGLRVMWTPDAGTDAPGGRNPRPGLRRPGPPSPVPGRRRPLPRGLGRRGRRGPLPKPQPGRHRRRPRPGAAPPATALDGFVDVTCSLPVGVLGNVPGNVAVGAVTCMNAGAVRDTAGCTGRGKLMLTPGQAHGDRGSTSCAERPACPPQACLPAPDYTPAQALAGLPGIP